MRGQDNVFPGEAISSEAPHNAKQQHGEVREETHEPQLPLGVCQPVHQPTERSVVDPGAGE